ncbi:hypothetical protein ACFY36_18960 [Actinoplanes sp. NPDC000266]
MEFARRRRVEIAFGAQQPTFTAPSSQEQSRQRRKPGLSEGFGRAALLEAGERVHLNGPGFPRPEFVMDTPATTMPLSPEQIGEIRGWGHDRAVPAGRRTAKTTSATGHWGRRVMVFGD